MDTFQEEAEQESPCKYNECDGTGYIEVPIAPDDSQIVKCRCLIDHLTDLETDNYVADQQNQ